MTEPLYRRDPYAQEIRTRIRGITEEGGLLIEEDLFYPTGGGQPGDSGWLVWEGGQIEIATTLKSPDGRAILVPAEAAPAPRAGAEVVLRLDWQRRHAHMRMHTALHLLSVVIPLPVTGGAIGLSKSRLDFDMPEAPADPAALEEAINRLVMLDLPVRESWISENELDANPSLVKTMAVAPPRGQGRVRLIVIGEGSAAIDLQPCGGTHVARTAEIGTLRLGKIEKKGRQNRRVTLLLDTD